MQLTVHVLSSSMHGIELCIMFQNMKIVLSQGVPVIRSQIIMHMLNFAWVHVMHDRRGFCGSNCEDYCLVRHDAMQFGRKIPVL